MKVENVKIGPVRFSYTSIQLTMKLVMMMVLVMVMMAMTVKTMMKKTTCIEGGSMSSLTVIGQNGENV